MPPVHSRCPPPPAPRSSRAGQLTGGDAYAGGRLLTNSTSIYNNCRGGANNCDLNFSVSGDLVAAVPVPSTWALLLVGFGAVGATLRRRKAHVRTALSFA